MTADRPIGNVLITGGASGLGAAVATAVREAGGRPLVLDLHTDGVDADAHEVDVSDSALVDRVVPQIIADAGGVDAVVTAAGIDRPGLFSEVATADWERIVAVNLLGTVAVVRAALPALTAAHGRAVLVASSLALRALPAATAYCASKFALVGFSRALAQELQGQVGVTTVFPAGMDTRFFDGRDAQYRPAPDAHLIDPAAVADAIVFALRQPAGVELREFVMCPDDEPSWP
jgi:NAD(P)-dependent dehydrogenase (short-subunit alcohol dehydrogenase family)